MAGEVLTGYSWAASPKEWPAPRPPRYSSSGVTNELAKAAGAKQPSLAAFTLRLPTGVDSEHCVQRTKADDPGNQRDRRQDQQDHAPYRADRCEKPDQQQHNPKHDASNPVDSAHVAFHGSLLQGAIG